MLTKLKKQLFDVYKKTIINYGLDNKEIIPIEKEVFTKLKHFYVSGVPLSIHLRMRPVLPPGRCYERRFYIALALDNAVVADGKIKSLESKTEKDRSGHGWVEKDGWVYDPTTLYKYKKELYYKIHRPYDLEYYYYDEYSEYPFYKYLKETKLEDLKPNGKKRLFLISTIPVIQEIVRLSNNQEVIEELNEYLADIEYDYLEVQNELNEAMNLFLKEEADKRLVK